MNTESLDLAPWVETHTETARGGRPFTVAVNRRTSSAILLDDEVPAAELEAALLAGGFLDNATPPVDAPRAGPVRRFLRTLDVHWTGADRAVVAVHRRVAWHAWRPGWILVQVVLAIAGLAAVIAATTSGRPLELRPTVAHVPAYIAISLASIAVHELGHAVVLAHHGRRVKSIGFRLHLGSPACYVESVEALLLTRRQRLLQAAAGPWAEWQFVSVIAIVLWVIPGVALAPVVHRFVVLGAFTVLVNLLPFAGLDGSLLLGDLLRQPNLAADSKDALRRLRHDRRRGDGLLVTYAVLNTFASSTLLVTSLGLWYLVFGHAVGSLADRGPLGVVSAAALLVISFGPMIAGSARSLRQLRWCDRIAFRLERRTRIRFTERLATIAPFDQLGERALCVIAGQLELHRVGRGNPLHAPAFSGYLAVDGDVRTGGDAVEVAPGVRRVGATGVTVTTRRWVGGIRTALLPDASLRLVGLGSPSA